MLITCWGVWSVVLTRHHPGRSAERSTSSTVWPQRTLISPGPPAEKSNNTTTNSQPPDSCTQTGRTDYLQAEGVTAVLLNDNNSIISISAPSSERSRHSFALSMQRGVSWSPWPHSHAAHWERTTSISPNDKTRKIQNKVREQSEIWLYSLQTAKNKT